MEGTFSDDALVDIEGKSVDELRALLNELYREEQEVSYRRRVLHGKIDILRAEIVRRMKVGHESGGEVISGADIDKLIEILSNDYRAILDAGEPEDDQS